jgi:hypothetical protein
MARQIPRGMVIATALAACAAALLAGSAQANTVVVGSSLTASNFALRPFSSPATVANYSLPAPATAASPVDGTVIGWRFIGTGGPLTPRVLRSSDTTSLAAAGTGAPQNATAPNVISGPFSTSLQIRQNDFFGVDGAAGASLSTAPTAGSASLYFTPALVDGAGELAPTGTNAEEDAISATVRYCLVPKTKGLTGNAARQALSAADCRLGNITRGKRKPIKTVLEQGVKAGTSISDTKAVDLTISRKKKS